jgi:peptidyl-prolyl cis-trans isomerase B (cyclophilin B)
MSAFRRPLAIAVAGLALAATAAAPALAAKGAPAKPTAAAGNAGAATIAQVEKAAGKKIQLGKTVTLQTTAGTIEIVLFPKEAPKTVENFTKLVKKGFYDGTTFHRVIPGFVSQGGDPLSKKLKPGDPQIGTGGPGYDIPDEHGNGLKHLPGAVAMAHSSLPNSAGSQFYIVHKPIPHLDGGYTIFGHVTKGFGVALKMTPSDRDGAPNQVATPVKIIKATIK